MILFGHDIHFIYNPDAIVHEIKKGDIMPIVRQCGSQETFNILRNPKMLLSYSDLEKLGITNLNDLQGIPNPISNVARRQLETNQQLLESKDSKNTIELN